MENGNIEIWDAYCGVGPWNRRDRLLPSTPEEIAQLMDYFGIARALVYGNMGAHNAWDEEANRIAVEAGETDNRFIPAFILAPHGHTGSPMPADYEDAMRRVGARAAWLWPQVGEQNHGLWPWLIGGLMEMCAAHHLPVLLSFAQLTPNDIHTFCENFPAVNLVLTGAPYTADPWLFPLLRRCERLHVCLGPSYIPAGNPMRFLTQFPTERLIFGSGLPHSSPGGLIGHVMYATIGESDKEQIFSGNLRRLLGEVTL